MSNNYIQLAGILAASALAGGPVLAQTNPCVSPWPSYMEVQKVEQSQDGNELKVILTLTDIPDAMSFNRFAPGPFPLNEYAWSVFVDTDGNAATGGRNGADYQLIVGHQNSAAAGGPATQPLASALNYAKVLAYQPQYGIYTPYDTVSATVDAAKNTITLRASVPGLGLQSRTYIQSESYDGSRQLTNYNPQVPPPPLPDSCKEEPPSYTVTDGIIPPDNAVANVSGSTESLSLSVDLKLAELFPTAAFAAAKQYNVYVAALVPGDKLGQAKNSSLWFQRPKSGVWTNLSSPLGAFLENVAADSQDAVLRVEVVRDTNLSTLVGTEFYIGYGTSDTEMLKNRRYRGIYKVK